VGPVQSPAFRLLFVKRQAKVRTLNCGPGLQEVQSPAFRLLFVKRQAKREL
jgi:hypothetical protein